jgi:hypothetical protein
VYLYTHISGLALQAFALQMAESSAQQEAQLDQSYAGAASPNLPDEQTLAEFLQQAYKDIPEVSAALAEKIADLSLPNIEQLARRLPTQLTPLTAPLNALDFRAWLEFTLAQNADSPLYQLHHLFIGPALLDEDPSEIIREAIAFDDPELLNSLDLNTQTISLEDLQLAVQATALQVLPTLLNARRLDKQEAKTLLTLACTFDGSLPILLAHIKPSAELLTELKQQTLQAEQLAVISRYEASL